MEQLLHDWRLGFLLFVRLLIACLCMALGAGILVGLQVALQVIRLPMPYLVFLLLEVFYVAVGCPLILASYARSSGLT